MEKDLAELIEEELRNVVVKSREQGTVVERAQVLAAAAETLNVLTVLKTNQLAKVRLEGYIASENSKRSGSVPRSAEG